MVEVIPKDIKDMWDIWNIRGIIILSLTFQTILICFSPLRKRTSRRLLIMLVWSSYLLAEKSATYAFGLISTNQGKDEGIDELPEDKKLMALWASFLLVHLGGSDTITAFSLEDNTLWLRHFSEFVFQASYCVYVVLKSSPNSLSTVIFLVFASGTIRNLETIMALYTANSDKFRDSMIQAADPGPNYAKLMEEYKAKKEARLPTKIILIDEPDKEDRPKKLLVHNGSFVSEIKELTHLEIVHYAYKFFKTFKGLVVNLIFSFRERDESLDIFENLKDPEEALRIIEIELGFLYDSLFTKIAILHTGLGTVSRVVSSVTFVAAFILFHKKPDKEEVFSVTDIKVTYLLFAVGIALDIVSIVLFLFSDWTYTALSSFKDNSEEVSTFKDNIFNWLLSLRQLRWKTQECHKKGDNKCSTVQKHDVLMTRFFLRRWSGSINVFNFIAFATKSEVKRIHDVRGRFRRYLWIIIVSPLENFIIIVQILSGWIAKLINDVHRWISHKVNELSRNHPWARSTIYPIYFEFISRIPHFIKLLWDRFSEFIDFSDKLDMVHKMLSIHREPMTKELWAFMFNEVKYKSKFGDNPENAERISLARGEWTLRDNLPEEADHEKMVRYLTKVDYDQSLLTWHIATELCYQQREDDDDNYKHYYSNREYSKIISDYMMYLLILQPGLMSEVAGIGEIRFRDTLAEAENFLERRQIEKKRSVEIATINILEVNSEIDPVEVKGDRSKSVLFEASRLAKELMQLEKRYKKNKWEILSKVWVELLCYAASQCDPVAHVEQLSRGGELINFIWFLMAHFGLTDKFQINEGDTRAKLIIGK